LITLYQSRKTHYHQSRQGTIEEKAVFDFEAGKSVDIIVEYTNTSPPVENGEGKSSQPALMRGVVSHHIWKREIV